MTTTYDKSHQMDMAKLALVVGEIDDASGNVIPTAQFSGITAGTAAASKALVADSSVNIAGINSVSALIHKIAAGGYIDADVATSTLSSNAATVTKYAIQVTTESLTTAAGASQALTLTLTGVAATDLAIVSDVGGTNTRFTYQYKAVCTSNTVTITVYNSGPTSAFNGTLVFNVIVIKAN